MESRTGYPYFRDLTVLNSAPILPCRTLSANPFVLMLERYSILLHNLGPHPPERTASKAKKKERGMPQSTLDQIDFLMPSERRAFTPEEWIRLAELRAKTMVGLLEKYRFPTLGSLKLLTNQRGSLCPMRLSGRLAEWSGKRGVYMLAPSTRAMPASIASTHNLTVIQLKDDATWSTLWIEYERTDEGGEVVKNIAPSQNDCTVESLSGMGLISPQEICSGLNRVLQDLINEQRTRLVALESEQHGITVQDCVLRLWERTSG